MKKKRRKYNVSAEQFITAWRSSETAREVAAKVGLPLPIVYARVSFYRRRGVRLLPLRRTHPKTLDVAALNRI